MKWKGIIFDLDGTLLDTLVDLAHSVNLALERCGFDGHEIDAYRYFIGDGFTQLIKRALPTDSCTDKNIRRCTEAFKSEYHRNWKTETKPYTGIPEMLDSLVKYGLKLGVLSNKEDSFAKKCVQVLLPRWQFEAVFGQCDHIPRKPDPAGALAIARIFDCAPSKILYVGDSSVDMKTGNAAGMFTVGVSWGFRPAAELVENGCQALIDNPMDLLELIA